MKSQNIELVIITILLSLTIAGMALLGIFSPIIQDNISEGSSIIQKSRDKIDYCELLNWDSYYLEHNLRSLDWYVAEMINDSLMTESVANNTLNKFLIDNSRKVSEIRGRSDVDEYLLFEGVTEIFIEWYIIDLFPQDDFYYNYTYSLLIEQYGVSTKPFILQFNTSLMTDIVDDYEFKTIKPLERCKLSFVWANGLLIAANASIGLGEITSHKRERAIISKIPYIIGSLFLIIFSLYLAISGVIIV